MTVALPPSGIASADPYFMDAGSVQRGIVGATDQRLNRLGDRFGCSFQTKPLTGNEARVWISRLIRGIREKATIKFPQPGVSFSTQFSTFSSNAAANAEIISLSQGQYLEGQFLSWVVAGLGYLHQFTNDGGGMMSVQPMLRTDVPAGTAVELAAARIEGYVRGEDQYKWTVDNAKKYGLSFVIEEAQ